jgi:hypothetical protein
VLGHECPPNDKLLDGISAVDSLGCSGVEPSGTSYMISYWWEN